MRNLKLITSLKRTISAIEDACCMSLDNDTGIVYVATKTELLSCQPTSGQVVQRTSLSSLPEADGTNAQFVSVQYLPEECSLCAATSSGLLILWSTVTNELECVGSVESGFTGMTWSPDQEILVLTTGADTLILMTREFDPILETALHSDQFGEAEFVQVGWGKKETQFHGSVGKAAAQVKQEDVKPAQSWDDRRPRVTWRGDGLFFAVGSVHPNTGARKVCVWSREGALHSTSENVDGIEQALSWKPSGSLLATSQRRPNKHYIAFFEKNGLRHGEFTLPFEPNQVKVKEVLWNLDSTVLAVWCEDLQPSENTNTYVQLWSVGNYHWYLKQSLHFTGPGERISEMMWDMEQAYTLHLLGAGGQYYQYAWAWATAYSTDTHSDNQALVAVIDGDQVLMTPTRYMVVPPPMSAYQLQLPAPVNHVCIAPPTFGNQVAVVLDSGKIALYRFTDSTDPAGVKADTGAGFQRCCPLPTLRGIFSITNLPTAATYPLTMSHFTWIGADTITFSTVMETEPFSTLHKATIEEDKITVVYNTNLESLMMGVAFDADQQCVAIEMTDGTMLKYIPEDDMVVPWETGDGDYLSLPQPCTQIAVTQVGGQPAVLGLTERYRFFVNDIEVVSGCTSFSVHDEFLLLTTMSHTCRFINLHTNIKDLPTLSDGKSQAFDESIRRVERGSRIVVSVRDDTRLVLQMPRGNLETIHPRALVLSAVRKHLNKLEYKEAFNLMRKHRINMNLLHDHNPAMFQQNVGQFVIQVEEVNNINLFLTDLVEEDVTVTMYPAAYPRGLAGTGGEQLQQGVPMATSRCKVDSICDAVRQALVDKNENKYMLSILTSYVRKTKPELAEALQIVKNLRDCKADMPHINVEEALKYLLFLVDVNELYDIALGTYDFDLVLMVAEKSHKDPKEYIPFLNQLRRLETNYQRYTIDKHLKRYNKALQHIVLCGAEHFNECLSLVSEHRLHPTALQLYNPGSQEYKDIASSYGDLLRGKHRYEEAAIMYVKAECWESALTSFVADLNWQQAFCMTAILKYTPEQDIAMARKLAEGMKTKHQHAEAAVILEQYAQDIEEAIVTLIEGAQWAEALRMMYKYKRTDFIETNLKPQLLDCAKQHMENLAETREKFNKYKNRLAIVRQEKEKARLQLIEGGGENLHDSDLFSDTSSATGESVQSARTSSSSIYSKMSGRSVRNRRKAEHKKWRLKEGSEFEDFALIAELAKIVTYMDQMRDDVRSLLRVLVQFHMDSHAEELQRTYSDILTLLDTSIPEIWISDNQPKVTPVLGPNTTANTIALALQQGQTLQSADQQEELDPIIKMAPLLRKEKHWKLYALET